MIINIEDLESQIIQTYVKYFRETRASIDTAYLWFDVTRNEVDKIWLRRKHSDVVPDKEYDVLAILRQWAARQEITDNDYLNITLWANGLEFSMMRDDFNVLDKSDKCNDLNLNNVKIPKTQYFGRVGL